MIPRTGRRGANRYESKRGEEVNMPEEKDLQLNEIEGDPAPRAATVDDDLNLPQGARDLEAVYDIPVQVSAVLGKASMQVSQLLKLGRGAVVELDRKVGEAIDIYVNNRLVARGDRKSTRLNSSH